MIFVDSNQRTRFKSQIKSSKFNGSNNGNKDNSTLDSRWFCFIRRAPKLEQPLGVRRDDPWRGPLKGLRCLLDVYVCLLISLGAAATADASVWPTTWPKSAAFVDSTEVSDNLCSNCSLTVLRLSSAAMWRLQ